MFLKHTIFGLIIVFMVILQCIVSQTFPPDGLLYIGDNQTRPDLGINVGTITSGMSQWVFTNKFKHAKQWRPVSTGNNWLTYSLAGAIPTNWDSNGYPFNFTYKGQWGGNNGYMTQLGTDGVYPTGNYIISWEGNGSVALFGDAQNVTVVNRNKFKFRVNLATQTGIIVIITLPNTTNIDLREEFEENSMFTFSTNFTNAIRPFKALRFSSWAINRKADYNPNGLSGKDAEWETRRPVTFYTQVGVTMVSIEYMVELGNFLSKDIWLSIPSAASQNYIQNMALYVKNNLICQSCIIYIEQSSDKNFGNSNRTLELNLVKYWKTANDSRVKHVLSTSYRAFFNNPPQFLVEDYAYFDYFSVSGGIGSTMDYIQQNYNVSLSANFTTREITSAIRQAIYTDEIDLIYMIQIVAMVVKKPLIGYDIGFRVHAPTYANRWKNTPDAWLEQRLEDLIIKSLYEPIVTDLYLDFMERWYRLGGGLMFLSNIVDKVDRCTPSLSNFCGYQSTLGNLMQIPDTVPKYIAAISWINRTKGNLPFTLADVPKPAPIACNSPCVWGTCYQGKCMCFNGYTGVSCDKRETKYLDCAPNSTYFGMNMNGVPDWSTEVTFTDIQKRSRKWIVQKIVYATKWADWDQNDINLDENGYPLFLKPGQSVGTFQVRDVQAHFPNGAYICLYDGDGVLDFSFDVKITKREAGRIEMIANWTTWLNNGMYYAIIRTNPSNPVRNIRIFEARFESTYEYFPYHPLFLELMKKYSVLRFMGWSNTETTGPIDWTNRTKTSHYSFNLNTGVSLEMQVNLCNTLGANPWFNIPYQATDNYIKNFATYIRDNLRPDVTIYIEQGNECWGLGTQCGIYAERMGLLENITIVKNQNLYSANLQARICYHAKMGKHYSDIIKDVFGPDQKFRIKFVLNTQAAWSGPIEVFFLCPGNVSQAFDIVALAPYLSDNMTHTDRSLVTLDEFFSTRIDNAVRKALNQTLLIANIVKKNAPTIEIGLYEAGPDFSSLTDTGNTYLTNLSYYIHRDPRIYSALTYYLSNLTQTIGLNLKYYNHFASAGICSKYGCWGIIESSDANLQLSPKYLAYNDFINSQKLCNWIEKSIDTCPGNCTLTAGVCSVNTLVSTQKDRCYCYFGNEFDHNSGICQIKYIVSTRCTYKCDWHGTCEFDHYEGFYAVSTCHCNTGYYGYGCGLFDCSLNCSYNGLCVDYNKCSCYRGYKGEFCAIDCGCKGHGVCSNLTNECVCDQGYSFVNNTCQIDCSISPSTRPECLTTCQVNCSYGDCVLGVCKCWAGIALDSKGSCTIKTRSQNDGSQLGINLSGVVDWSTQWAFVDIAIGARSWITQHIDKLNDLYIWSLNENATLSNDNYPTNIPYQRQYSSLMLRDVQQRWPNSTYHVFYDGEGELDFGFDAKIINSNEKYKMKLLVNLTIQLNNGVFMKIKKTNPLNPLRNIRIVLDGYENIYSKVPFHPMFLERLRDFKTIRFMPWTAQDGIVKWTDRITKTMFTKGKGVAYEYMIHLCNILKTNCWLTIPYAANDEFVTNLATLVLNNLRKDVKVYVEYTNEAWNLLFSSGKYCLEKGLSMNFSTDQVIARNLFYSFRSQQIIKIWQDVYQSEQDRIVLVLGTFVLMPAISTRILSYNNASSSHSNVMLAITGYISCGTLPASIVAISNLSYIFSGCDTDFSVQQALIKQHVDIAKQFSVQIGMYESGSGLVEYNAMITGSATPGATEKYIAANRDKQMYFIYMRYYTMFNSFNLTENCHFEFVGLPSLYGSYGLLEYQNQNISTAYRYQAILDIINQTRLVVTNRSETTTPSAKILTTTLRFETSTKTTTKTISKPTSSTTKEKITSTINKPFITTTRTSTTTKRMTTTTRRI